jgi:large subunit ribosomal protein L23
MDIEKVIIEPVITEKSNRLMEESPKKYVFRVDSRANKHEIMKAVHEMFSVRPIKCRVMNTKGKPRTVRSRSGYRVGRTLKWKKAIVTLSQGETIDMFEGV